MPIYNRFSPLAGDKAQGQPSYRSQQQWTDQPTNYPLGQRNRSQQRRPAQWQTAHKGQQNYQGMRPWPAQYPRQDTRNMPNFRGRPNTPPRFARKYRPQGKTRDNRYEMEPHTRRNNEVQIKEQGRVVEDSTDSRKLNEESLQTLMTTMTSLKENMAKLMQQTKETTTNTSTQVNSPQLHEQPASYPWQVNGSTSGFMVLPEQPHQVYPAATNLGGQNIQAAGQYSHPIWQCPVPRAWGHSPWGHL